MLASSDFSSLLARSLVFWFAQFVIEVRREVTVGAKREVCQDVVDVGLKLEP